MAQKSNKQKIKSEIFYCDDNKIACDGGVGALGHPQVYLQMDDTGQATCPYCDKIYIKAGGASDKR